MRSIPFPLADLLESYGRLAIALSGGVDSAVVLAATAEVLGTGNVAALTAEVPYVAEREIMAAREVAESLGVAHYIEELPFPAELRDNPEKRCFLCKKKLLGFLQGKARELGFPLLADGSNADDSPENRPGMRALEHLGIASPLRSAGITKINIRTLARAWNLSSAEKPSNTCLLTRFPSGRSITDDDLHRVESAEDYLLDRGYAAVRVRDFGSMACIEAEPEEVPRLASDGAEVASKLKSMGYGRVTLDLEGYRFASMNVRKEKADE